MTTRAAVRDRHPCLARACGHPETVHTLTPELAGPAEVVVWCSTCRRHETRLARRWMQLLGRSDRRVRRKLGRAV